jgi:hypothetical protein
MLRAIDLNTGKQIAKGTGHLPGLRQREQCRQRFPIVTLSRKIRVQRANPNREIAWSRRIFGKQFA